MAALGEVRPELVRVEGIEPSSQAWEAHVLPMNYTRDPRAGTLARGRNWGKQKFPQNLGHLSFPVGVEAG